MSMHVRLRNWLAVSLIVSTAIDGEPKPPPVGALNARLTVSLASTIESGHRTTGNVCDATPFWNVSVPDVDI